MWAVTYRFRGLIVQENIYTAYRSAPNFESAIQIANNASSRHPLEGKPKVRKIREDE